MHKVIALVASLYCQWESELILGMALLECYGLQDVIWSLCMYLKSEQRRRAAQDGRSVQIFSAEVVALLLGGHVELLECVAPALAMTWAGPV